jgi:peroxiredoxin Q/BCP
MTSLGVGDLAPDLVLTTQHGAVSLASLAQKGVVVVYFYPKDDTPACTLEACGFRDAYEVFVDQGASVVGVSGDSAESHRRFAERHRLPFLLASDPDFSAHDAFGARKLLGLLPGRVTYVIDGDRVVRHVFESQMFPKRHVQEALEVVRRLGRERRARAPRERG